MNAAHQYYERYPLVLGARDSLLFELLLVWPYCLADVNLKFHFIICLSMLSLHFTYVLWIGLPRPFLSFNVPSCEADTGKLKATSPRPPSSRVFI